LKISHRSSKIHSRLPQV